METILTKQRTTTFLPLYAVILLGFLGYALTITLYIPMLMDAHFQLLPTSTSSSMRATLSGLLLAMYPLGQFFGSPIIGGLSDYYGRKKILLLSLGLCTLGFSGMGLSIAMHNIGLLFFFSFFTGLCESNMAISQSIIADLTQHDSCLKTKLIGYGYSACSLGYILGPLLAGGAPGYSTPFYIVAITVPLLMLWISLNLEEQFKPNTNVDISFVKSILAVCSIFKTPKLTKIYLINFCIFFAVQGLYRVAPLYVEDTWHPSLQTFAVLISYVSLMCFLANLLILPKLAARYSNKTLLPGLLAVSFVAILAIGIPSGFHWIWLTYGFAVIPTVMALPTCTTWLSEQVGADQQGQVLGNNQALLVLGEASSAAIGGLIAAIYVPLPLIMTSIILLGTAVAITQMNR